MSGELTSNSLLRALKRFWWLLLIGLAVAGLAAIAAVARIDFTTMPPALERRVQPTYTASARLLVTSAEAPYFRTTVPRTAEVPADVEGTGSTTFRSAPDIGTLIATANLYPVLIESDEVQKLRQELAGPLPGSVTARAIYAVNSASRFELSQVPVVEIYAISNTYGGAVKLAQATVDAFMTYIDQTQDAANLKRGERILLQQIQRPDGAVASGGASLSLPLMLFVVIGAAFAALAILLDRLFPFGLVPPLRWRTAPVPEGEAGTVEPGSEPDLPTRLSKYKV